MLNETLATVKKKKTPPLEKKVKEYLARRVRALGKALNMEVFVDWPPASEYGVQGRPDATLYIGHHCVMVEVKREKPYGRLSPTQEVWIERHRRHHGHMITGVPVFVAYGHAGVDSVITQIVALIEERNEVLARAGL